MEIMELHQLVSLCSNETDAFKYLFEKKKELNYRKLDVEKGTGKGIYQIAPDLQYVKLVEHGSAKSGDWYTTTSYRIIDNNPI